MADSLHRKTVKHYHRPGDLHELSFSCYRRMPLLTNDDWRRRFSRIIEEALKETAMQLVAFVYMPEHVHLIVDPLEDEPRLEELLIKSKQPFSHEIKEILEANTSALLNRLTIKRATWQNVVPFLAGRPWIRS